MAGPVDFVTWIQADVTPPPHPHHAHPSEDHHGPGPPPQLGGGGVPPWTGLSVVGRVEPEEGVWLDPAGFLSKLKSGLMLLLALHGGCGLALCPYQHGAVVKNLPANVADLGSVPGLGRSFEEGMATHLSILAWRILWTEEPGGLWSMEL